MPINILFDANNLAVRILCALPVYNKQFESNHQKNLYVHSFLSSFLSILKQIKQKYDIDNINLIWDSKISYRKEVYPEYKANRKPRTDIELMDRKVHFNLLEILKNNLLQLGKWACIEQDGFEADDLIAYIIKESTFDNQFIIVSSDNDLYQLLNGRVIIYLLNKKKFYTHLDFKKEFGITPDKYPQVKSLAGDNSDNIKGIDGIGIKKATKMIMQGKCWSHWITKYSNIDLETNMELTKLPFRRNDINIKLEQNYFDKDKWISLFQEFQLNKLILKDFKDFLDK